MSTTLTNRKVNLLQATAINMIDMVGIGPFVVMPFVVAQFSDGLFVWAWIFGAITAYMDAMIWSELGANYPLAGGTYNFHRIAYGEKGGKLMSFLFVWQTSIQAPLVVASAAIGFAQYLTYITPLDPVQQKLVSGALVIFVVILLYRKIETVGWISVAFGLIVIGTMLWIIFSGFAGTTHPVKLWPESTGSFFKFTFWTAVAHGSLKTVYAYLGYYNVCHLGGEIKNPRKNIPRSIFISITAIAILYLLMNVSVMGVMPWESVREDDRYIVSSFMEKLHGPNAGVIVTVLILCVAMSSLFAVILGYSRIPYAAAVDGNFFRIFGRLHPTRNFPHLSLLMIGGLGFIFSLFMRLSDVITSILAMRILVQFMAQAVGVVLLRKRIGAKNISFKMWFYPIPVILSLLVWAYLFYHTGWFGFYGTLIALAGVGFYFLIHNRNQDQDLQD